MADTKSKWKPNQKSSWSAWKNKQQQQQQQQQKHSKGNSSSNSSSSSSSSRRRPFSSGRIACYLCLFAIVSVVSFLAQVTVFRSLGEVPNRYGLLSPSNLHLNPDPQLKRRLIERKSSGDSPTPTPIITTKTEGNGNRNENRNGNGDRNDNRNHNPNGNDNRNHNRSGTANNATVDTGKDGHGTNVGYNKNGITPRKAQNPLPNDRKELTGARAGKANDDGKDDDNDDDNNDNDNYSDNEVTTPSGNASERESLRHDGNHAAAELPQSNHSEKKKKQQPHGVVGKTHGRGEDSHGVSAGASRNDSTKVLKLPDGISSGASWNHPTTVLKLPDGISSGDSRNHSTKVLKFPDGISSGASWNHPTKVLKLPEGWHKLNVGRKLKPDKNQFPSDFAMIKDPVDVLGEQFNRSSLRLDESILTDDGLIPHLGVLLDAGRHYFSPEWIRRTIDVLSAMKFNLLHFRLTDDQAFNVLLESQPRLAYPAARHNNTRVYSPSELREIVRYAKQKGIAVVPEINVPGHGGSWGGIPDLIVQCPNFICRKGYGVPLNVSNPSFWPVLKDVLTEVIDIFEDPPYLHLGGDEVHMAQPCFEEVGADVFDYESFETTLQKILKEISYDESRVIRWETTHNSPSHKRAGAITQFWHMSPGEGKFGFRYQNFTDPVFLSTGLYMDVNQEDSAYDVYVKTKKLKHNRHAESPILGIIAATFELDQGFWLDRNVIGRLLAVSMGVSGMNTTNRFQFLEQYGGLCRSIGLDDTVCRLYGSAPKGYISFRRELKESPKRSVWSDWIDNICERLTVATPDKKYKKVFENSVENSVITVRKAQKHFWSTYFGNHEWGEPDTIGTLNSHADLGAKRLVNHTGLIMDPARYPFEDLERGTKIIEKTMGPLGLDTVQLRLVTDVSFAYDSFVFPTMAYTPHVKLVPDQRMYTKPTMTRLVNIRNNAAKSGVSIMPEIAISTNAGGWYRSSFRVECPNTLCQHGEHIPQNVSSEGYPPVVYSVVEELLSVTSSRYIHLGHDDREANTPCFLEASNNAAAPEYDRFETTIRDLLRFAGVTSDRVVRWENREQTRYPGRFGDVTQCQAGEDCRLATAKASEPWFGTVDVRKGGAFDIYSSTRALAALGPIGIMAEIGPMSENIFQLNQIDYRLLAFSIGTLDLPVMTKDDFESMFTRTCGRLDLAGGEKDNGAASCKEFATADPSDAKGGDQDWKDLIPGICKDRTLKVQVHKMREAESIATAISMSTE